MTTSQLSISTLHLSRRLTPDSTLLSRQFFFPHVQRYYIIFTLIIPQILQMAKYITILYSYLGFKAFILLDISVPLSSLMQVESDSFLRVPNKSCTIIHFRGELPS